MKHWALAALVILLFAACCTLPTPRLAVRGRTVLPTNTRRATETDIPTLIITNTPAPRRETWRIVVRLEVRMEWAR